MTVFVWDDVDDLTRSYHSGGGLVVVARDLEHARELVVLESLREGSSLDLKELPGEPTATYRTGVAEPRVYVFPNAGCC
jgi:hypothetical protein